LSPGGPGSSARTSASGCSPRATEYEEQLANPYIAAERGYVDSVIPPSLTRTYVVRALRALRTKRQTLPAKKHGNIPL